MGRRAEIQRETKETRIRLELDLDGTGKAKVATGVGFLDHMLDLFARHSRMNLVVEATGDVLVDDHHTVEDVGICLGRALDEALGTKAGIVRFGFSFVPMDETLSRVVVDLSGRPFFVYEVSLNHSKVGSFDTELVEEFLRAFSTNAKINLHVRTEYGRNSHHIVESIFKALARALRQATRVEAEEHGVPSTKGVL